LTPIEILNPTRTTVLIGALMGESRALRCVLAALISTHPDRELLRQTWNLSKPQSVDKDSMDPRSEIPGFMDGYLMTLGAFAETIEKEGDGGPPETED
jgi:hypothetical protein